MSPAVAICALRVAGNLACSQDWPPHNSVAAQLNFPDRQTRRGRDREIWSSAGKDIRGYLGKACQASRNADKSVGAADTSVRATSDGSPRPSFPADHNRGDDFRSSEARLAADRHLEPLRSQLRAES
jgi:hypothetical protein